MALYRVPVLEKFEWQPPVINYQSAPPGSPAKGQRYIVLTTGTGVWAGHDEAIATFDGTNWLFDLPSAVGWVTYLQTGSKYMYYGGAVWAELDMKAKTHAASHKSGGADAIKLDELAEPTDVTTLDASTSKHGLLKKLPGGTSTFLRADGAFAAPSGSVPTGTGSRHVTAGSEDAAAKLVENADVAAAAAIAESKLALNNPTHSAANDPTADQKAALPGTSGTPSITNKYVTDQDARNANARTPTSHASTHIPGAADPVAGVGAYDPDYRCLLFNI